MTTFFPRSTNRRSVSSKRRNSFEHFFVLLSNRALLMTGLADLQAKSETEISLQVRLKSLFEAAFRSGLERVK
jgi:hypothetical protein